MRVRSGSMGKRKHRLSIPGVAVACLVAILSQGCDGIDPPGRGGGDDGFVLRDSAGIEIVENREPALAVEAAWHVEAHPFLEIGLLEGDPNLQFDRIVATFAVPETGAADAPSEDRSSIGRVVVLDGGSRELRFFGPDGTFLYATGGPGDGPGELGPVVPSFSRNMAGPYPAAGDSIWVHDMLAGRLHIFDGEGTFGRVVRAPQIRSNWVRGPTASGHFVLTTNSGDTPLPPEAGWSYEHFMTLDGATGTVDTLGVIPLLQQADPTSGASPVLAAGSRLEGAPAGILHAVTDRYEIRIYDPEAARMAPPRDPGSVEGTAAPPLHGLPDGGLVRVIRRVHEPVPAAGSEWEKYVAARVEQRVGGEDVDPAERARIRSALEEQPRNDYFPVLANLLADRAGNLWIRRYEIGEPPESRWDVFDADGRWLGEVAVPGDLEVRDIGDDYVLGIRRDELGVERVRAHRLRK